MRKHISIGVIGHVDHGKTSLVRAMTGIDTDRLQEEKARGLSIVLGFAWLELDDGVIDLIDVPGHENFIRTMVAGATGIEAVLLVVDAREGIKPQTAEHLAITGLLGIRHGVIAISKCDQASGEQRLATLEQLRTLLKGASLGAAPAVFVSALTGEGLDQLRLQLRALLTMPAPAAAGNHWYLPVDRAFSMPGCGTVVTGTLRLGRLRPGAEAELMPAGTRTSVRRLQVHRHDVDEVLPGQRVGVNLRHLRLQMVVRGHVLAAPGLICVSALLDASVTLLAGVDRPLVSGQIVRLLFGTTEVLARVRLLANRMLEPGQQGFAQIHTGSPVAAVAGEPFILRSDAPPMTIGGGRFLDPSAQRHKSFDRQVLERLQVLASGSGRDVLVERLKQAGYKGIPLQQLAAVAGIHEERLAMILADGLAAVTVGAQILYAPFVDAIGEMLMTAIREYHHQHPTRAGAPLSWCRSSLPRTVDESVFRFTLQRLCAGQRIGLKDGIACIYGYDPLQALTEAQRRLATNLERSIRQGGLMPPDPEQLLEGEEDGLEMLYLLVGIGKLVLLPGEQAGRRVAFHSDAVWEAIGRLQRAFPPPMEFTVSECRMLLSSTRKYMVPLLQYLDAKGYTQRNGDRRSMTAGADQWR